MWQVYTRKMDPSAGGLAHPEQYGGAAMVVTALVGLIVKIVKSILAAKAKEREEFRAAVTDLTGAAQLLTSAAETFADAAERVHSRLEENARDIRALSLQGTEPTNPGVRRRSLTKPPK